MFVLSHPTVFRSKSILVLELGGSDFFREYAGRKCCNLRTYLRDLGQKFPTVAKVIIFPYQWDESVSKHDYQFLYWCVRYYSAELGFEMRLRIQTAAHGSTNFSFVMPGDLEISAEESSLVAPDSWGVSDVAINEANYFWR